MPLRETSPHLYYSYVVFVVFCAIASFAPLILNFDSNMENSPLTVSLQSKQFRESSIAILALNFAFCYVFVLERAGEMFSTSYMFQHQKRFLNRMKIVTDVETFLYLAGTIMVPMITLFPANYANPGLLYLCASQAEIILLGGYVVIMCARYYSRYFPTVVIVCSLVISCVGSVIYVFAQNAASSNPGHSSANANASFYMQWAGGAVFFLCAFIWLYYEFLLKLVLPRCRRLYDWFRRKSQRPGTSAVDDVADDVASTTARRRGSGPISNKAMLSHNDDACVQRRVAKEQEARQVLFATFEGVVICRIILHPFPTCHSTAHIRSTRRTRTTSRPCTSLPPWRASWASPGSIGTRYGTPSLWARIASASHHRLSPTACQRCR